MRNPFSQSRPARPGTEQDGDAIGPLMSIRRKKLGSAQANGAAPIGPRLVEERTQPIGTVLSNADVDAQVGIGVAVDGDHGMAALGE